MTASIFLLTFFMFIGLAAVGLGVRKDKLEVVQSVDLNRYVGRWYEIARLPNSFQKKCADAVTANYTKRAGGKIEVILKPGGKHHPHSLKDPAPIVDFLLKNALKS